MQFTNILDDLVYVTNITYAKFHQELLNFWFLQIPYFRFFVVLFLVSQRIEIKFPNLLWDVC